MIIASRPPSWSTWSPVVSHDPVPVCFVSLLVLRPLQGEQWASMGSAGPVGCPWGPDSQEPPPLLLNGGLSLSSKLWDQKNMWDQKKKNKKNPTKPWDQKSQVSQPYTLSHKKTFPLITGGFFILLMSPLPDGYSIRGHSDVALLFMYRFHFALPCCCLISPLLSSSLCKS